MSDLVSYLEGMGCRRSAGAEYIVPNCPWCGKANRLYVNSDVGETWDGKEAPAGRWICFSCGERGMSFAKLMAELDSLTFDQARSIIGRWKAGGYSWKRIEAKAKPTVEDWLPAEYEPVSKVWPKYLTTRNILPEVAHLLDLGVCRTGDYANRVVLPVVCPLGRCFQARAIHAATEPRYMSGPNAGQLLFGWKTIEEQPFGVIVEGPFDALKVIQAGLPCVALMGKHLGDSQEALLKRKRRRWVVMLDPIAKDPDAVDSAIIIAEKLGGLVATSLQTDPGAATEDDIRAAYSDAIPPAEAQREALAIRMAQKLEKKLW